MKLSSANLIASGQRELRAIGEKCDPACFVWYGCGNSKPDGICAGFLLLDGETKRHLHKLLSENDGKYVANCVRMLQSGSNEETKKILVEEVLRFIPPKESEPRATGFTAMCEAARPARTSETVQPELQTPFGFLRMLDSNYQAHVAGESDETHSHTPCGFGEMLEAAFSHGNPKTPDKTPHVVRRGLGFAAMLEAASRGT